MRFEKSIFIGVSKGRVWDVLTDFKNYPLWMGSNEKVEFISSETEGKGATFSVLGIMGRIRYRTYNKVVEWKEDEELVIAIESMFGKGYSTYQLNKVPGGCEVFYTLNLKIPKKFQEKPDVVYKSFNDSMEEVLNRLQTYLEAVP